MIIIRLNNIEFEQDIRPLVLAFYPGSIMKVIDIDADLHQLYSEGNVGASDRVLSVVQSENEVCFKLAGVEGNCKETLLKEMTCPVPAEIPGQEYRITRKNQLKRDLYRFISEYEKRTLPWGTLTGIRPIKIVTAMLDDGLSDERIKERLKDEYYMSDKKQEISIHTAKNEQKIISSLKGTDAFSLYVGIPFCPSTCAYCSFTSYPLAKWKNQVERYIDCVIKELDVIAEQTQGKNPETIYIGGGTPTTLEPVYIEKLFGAICDRFDLSDLKEWTVEAGRPDSITKEKLEAIRKFPVDRISVNPQTMKEETLKLIGRRHTVEQTREAFKLVRECGFENINMDLIMGLPGETISDVEDTINEIIKLAPESLTVHTLALKRAARLNTNAEDYAGYTMQNTVDMLYAAHNGALKMEMEPYYLYRQKNMVGNLENVGYAKNGKFGIYNILIMEEIQSIYAAGAGAATKLVFDNNRHERIENVKDVGQYMDRIDEMLDRKRNGGKL